MAEVTFIGAGGGITGGAATVRVGVLRVVGVGGSIVGGAAAVANAMIRVVGAGGGITGGAATAVRTYYVAGNISIPVPIVASLAVTDTVIWGNIVPKVCNISGVALTTSFIDGRIEVNPPKILAPMDAECNISVPAPVIEASATTTIAVSGNFVAPGVDISAAGYTWLVGAGAFYSKLPTISGQVEQPKGIYGRLNSPLIRIAGTLLRTEYINGAVNVRPPKILAAVAIHDSYQVIRHQREGL